MDCVSRRAVRTGRRRLPSPQALLAGADRMSTRMRALRCRTAALPHHIHVCGAQHLPSRSPDSSLFRSLSPDGQKKAYVRLTQDYDALDVANRIGII